VTARNRKVLISGVGIAGPTLAYWLRRFGFEPTLIERASALREGGYMVDFWGLGFDVAERMGLAPALRATGYDIEEVRLVDARGRRAGGFNARIFRDLLFGRYTSILRSDLSRLVYDALGGGVRTLFGDSITGIDQDADGADVTFLHAAPERFDLVIGAGGLHSPVRSLVFGPEERFEKYLGYYTASYSIENYPIRDPAVYMGYAAPGRQATRYALRDGRTVVFFVFSRGPDATIAPHDIAAQKQILRAIFGRDGWEVPDFLSALDGATDLYFDAISQISMETWSKGRVALVGDACSCPSLLAGQGSALAMAGAYILAGELKKADGDYRSAFAAYEALFHPFIVGKQNAAARFAGSFAPKTRFGIFLRNQVTRVMTVPFIADWAMGDLVRDKLTLPAYG
jgi:2-polyprenyl-6-methoxyphenol hydroxylase-like FAD-dependent oxidoreductase